MDKRKLRELIVEHKEKALQSQDYIQREAIIDPGELIKQKEIHTITGVRRCGKSTLLRILMKYLTEQAGVNENNILYLNFEDERFVQFDTDDFQPLYESYMEIGDPRGKKYFFLDEIQNVPAWERWVSRLYEFEDIKFFITGSNASLLSGEIATSLTGRHRTLELYPFSFREFAREKGVEVNEKELLKSNVRTKARRLFDEYLTLGGFPEIVKTSHTDLVQEYFRDILFRDIVIRYSIRNVRQLKELALYLASNVSSVSSYKKLKDLIGVKSLGTVKNYLHYFEEAFLFFRVSLFDYSLKRQIYNPEKIYCVDHSIPPSVGFSFSPNIGKILENIVFIELRRRGKEVYYWKSKKGKEVDFIEKKGNTLINAIQVSFNLVNEETRNREIQGALSAHRELGIKKVSVLTFDTEGDESINGLDITYIPVWKWLLRPFETKHTHGFL